MSNYKPYNPNSVTPKGTDCVIRALCAVTGRSWLDVFDGLAAIAREQQIMLDTKECYGPYLEQDGWTWVPLPATRGKKRPTVSVIARQVDRAVCRCAHHLVSVHDGYYWDDWDSGDCCIYGYWTKG